MNSEINAKIWQRNPHRVGSKYWKLFNYMQYSDKFTRAQFVEFARGLRDSKSHAYYNVTVMISPKNFSTRGNILGNAAAAGHLYYVEKLERRIIFNEREPQHYKFRWREEKLIPLKRESTWKSKKNLEIDNERTSNPHAIVHRVVDKTSVKNV